MTDRERDDEEQREWLDNYAREQRARHRIRDEKINNIRIEIYHAGILSRIGGFFRILAAKWRYR